MSTDDRRIGARSSFSDGVQLDLIRKGLRSPSEKRRERPEAREEARNVRVYMSTDDRRIGARSSFSDGL